MEQKHKTIFILILLTVFGLALFQGGRVFLRIILGWIFCLFLPGFLLMKILVDKMDAIERMAYSFGLSLCILAFVCFILDSVWEISLFSLVICLSIISLILAIVYGFTIKKRKK